MSNNNSPRYQIQTSGHFCAYTGASAIAYQVLDRRDGTLVFTTFSAQAATDKVEELDKDELQT